MLQVWRGVGERKWEFVHGLKLGLGLEMEENPQKTQDIEKESTKYSWKYFVKKSTFNKK